jgi:AcrR family transcriptional regulator
MQTKTQKSELTTSAIVDAAIEIATTTGLFSVTLQSVADKLHLSKSGIFSRIGSKEALQIAVVDEYGKRFVAAVFLPAMQHPKGLQRLNAVVKAWFDRLSVSHNLDFCLFETAAFAITSDAEGTLRKHLVRSVANWRAAMGRTVNQCIEQGQLNTDTDAEIFLFELHSIILGALYDSKFMGEAKTWPRAHAAYAQLIARYTSSVLHPR